jgi:hypothetical protein
MAIDGERKAQCVRRLNVKSGGDSQPVNECNRDFSLIDKQCLVFQVADHSPANRTARMTMALRSVNLESHSTDPRKEGWKGFLR